MTTLLYIFLDNASYDKQLQQIELTYFADSEAAKELLADVYVRLLFLN